MIKSDKMEDVERVPFTVQVYVRNFKEILDFYCNILGFKIIRKHPNEKLAILSFHKSILIINSESGRGKIKTNTGIQLRFLLKGNKNDLKEYYKKIKSKGVKIIKPLKRRTYGLLTFHIKDPNRLELKFCV